MLGQPGFVVAGKYRIDGLIGEGGMGCVWRAWDESLDRAVALKLISDEAASSVTARQRFLAEAKAAAGLRTPHVVQILERGVEGDTPFIVMELLEGEDLHERAKRRRRLAPIEVCEIVRQVLPLTPADAFAVRVGDGHRAGAHAALSGDGHRV